VLPTLANVTEQQDEELFCTLNCHKRILLLVTSVSSCQTVHCRPVRLARLAKQRSVSVTLLRRRFGMGRPLITQRHFRDRPRFRGFGRARSNHAFNPQIVAGIVKYVTLRFSVGVILYQTLKTALEALVLLSTATSSDPAFAKDRFRPRVNFNSPAAEAFRGLSVCRLPG
jgi:hypothetical protein